jgi:PPM family protein phosphatase
MLVWHTAAFTHRGRVRTANEDNVAIEGRILTGDMAAPAMVTIGSDVCVLMIADGMGGHHHGAMASHALLDHLTGGIDRVATPSTCADAIQAANDHLYELMRANPHTAGMGATLVGAVLTSTQLLIFNAGDSRGYLQSGDHLIQLSQDDVPDARIDGSRPRVSHSVTQAIGGSTFHVPIKPHISVEPPLRPGETLLLCSDGLTDMVSDSIIQDVLRKATNIGAAVRSLAAHAFRAGAVDNISLVLAKRAA